jgi:enoyl-CoA hydratase/carnithine racemase
MSGRHLSLENRDGVALLRLGAGKLNAISPPVLDELHAALDAIEGDASIAMVLTGEPSKFFSFGLDVAALLDHTREGMSAFFDGFNRLVERLFLFPKPTVAAVNGHAMAGGLLLAACADARVGAEGDYRLALTEVKLGLVVPAGSARILAHRFGPAAARDLCLTGRDLDPVRAREAGLLDALVPHGELIDAAAARGAALAAVPAPAFAAGKRYLGAGVVETDEERVKVENRLWLDLWFSPQARERLRALIERR